MPSYREGLIELRVGGNNNHTGLQAVLDKADAYLERAGWFEARCPRSDNLSIQIRDIVQKPEIVGDEIRLPFHFFDSLSEKEKPVYVAMSVCEYYCRDNIQQTIEKARGGVDGMRLGMHLLSVAAVAFFKTSGLLAGAFLSSMTEMLQNGIKLKKSAEAYKRGFELSDSLTLHITEDPDSLINILRAEREQNYGNNYRSRIVEVEKDVAADPEKFGKSMSGLAAG